MMPGSPPHVPLAVDGFPAGSDNAVTSLVVDDVLTFSLSLLNREASP
jgi:hypothetical protein